jgi:hypothetical protein
MRLTVRSLRQVVKGDLRIEFVRQQLTSYGGLELFHRYFRRMEIRSRLRRAFAAIPSDYGGARRSQLTDSAGDLAIGHGPRPSPQDEPRSASGSVSPERPAPASS